MRLSIRELIRSVASKFLYSMLCFIAVAKAPYIF
jgi:hypothetical protein